MGIKITEAAADSSVTGVELLPVSDGGSPKSVTVTNIKDFVIDQIEAISAGSSVSGSDSVFIMQSGVLKPVDIDLVAQHAIDTIWGKTAETSPDDADVLPLKDGGSTEKTVTLAYLATYIKTTIESAILDVSDLSAATTPADADNLLITVGTTGKKITYANFVAAVYDALSDYVDGLDAVTAGGDTDIFYIIQGGVEKKMTLAQLATYIGTSNPVSGPSSTTTDYLVQWADTGRTTKDGPALVTTVGAVGADTNIPTEQAVREAIGISIIDDLTDIGTAIADADYIMVDDGGAGTARKSVITRLVTYLLTKLSADTLAANTDITTNDATTSLHGLMSKTDKAKLDSISSSADVTDSASVNSAGATMNTDIDISGNTWVVDEDTLSSDLATKVPTQQSVKAYMDARIPQAVDGTLPTGDNSSFDPTKLVYDKTCSDSTGHDVIGLNDGTVVGQMLTIYLGTKSGTDNAIITPATALSYTTITLDAVDEIATLQWQGSSVGWAILYSNGTIA